MYLKISPKPSIFLSNKTSIASGVPSRPVTPVPPVVITAFIDSLSIHSEIIFLIGHHDHLKYQLSHKFQFGQVQVQCL